MASIPGLTALAAFVGKQPTAALALHVAEGQSPSGAALSSATPCCIGVSSLIIGADDLSSI
jgi:hypothetical protein